MKLSKKQINLIIKNTPDFLKEKQYSFIEDFGYYRPSDANWSYQVGWVYNEAEIYHREQDKKYLVVKVFGVIK